LSYLGFLDFFFLWSLASFKLDSARRLKVAAEFVRLIDSVSSLPAAKTAFLANRRLRLRAFFLKWNGRPMSASITSSIERRRG
jgi:hypothetical protein